MAAAYASWNRFTASSVLVLYTVDSFPGLPAPALLTRKPERFKKIWSCLTSSPVIPGRSTRVKIRVVLVVGAVTIGVDDEGTFP